MVKDMVYQFLDKYVGGGVNITLREWNNILYPPEYRKKMYDVRSDNGTLVLYFSSNYIGGVDLFFSISLLETMGNMFSLSRKQCKEYIRLWFCEKNNIKDYRELLNFPIIDKKYGRDSI
jgi:hypothetical protein